MSATVQPLIYRINVAATKLGVSRSTLYRLIKAHQLVMVKISSRASGITADSINAFLEKAKQPA